MILINSAKCLKCGDEIFSAHRHNYVECSCGNVFVDGGMEYLRHGYADKEKYMDLSIVVDDLVFDMCMSALEWSDETGRNNLGKLCAIFRALRDAGFLDGR